MVTITTDGITIEAENLSKARTALKKALRARDEREAIEFQKCEKSRNEADRNSLLLYRLYFGQVVPGSWTITTPSNGCCLARSSTDGKLYVHQGNGAGQLEDDLGVISGIEASSGVIAIRCQPIDSEEVYFAVGVYDDVLTLHAMPAIVCESLWKLTDDQNSAKTDK